MSSRLQDVEMQLSELEILQSMYPDENEIVIDDQLIFSELKKFSEDHQNDPLRTLKFILKLRLQDSNCALHVEFTPPLNYPSEAKISAQIRSSNFTKIQYTNINEALKKFIDELDGGEPQILQIIDWINENSPNHVTINAECQSPEESKSVEKESKQFSRIWIYSHHIYNKVKRKNILEWAKDLNLTGFSMPGKPGVVCVEGPSENCEEFWLRLKRLNWKHIEVRHREILGQEEIRNFTEMEEVCFEVQGNRGNHMNMGSLFQHMSQHDCGNVFVHLFGVEGRLPKKGEALDRMRRQTWKRLSLVHREDGIFEVGGSGTFVRKFPDPVSEKDFSVHGGRDYHMDLGQFAAFLADHQSHDLFSILFGVAGKVKFDD